MYIKRSCESAKKCLLSVMHSSVRFFSTYSEPHTHLKGTMCINDMPHNLSVFKDKEWGGGLKAVMRLLWAKWANIPRIIISNLARTWGTEESSSEQTALRSSAGCSLNEYSSVKPLMDLLQLSQLQGSSGCLPENLPAKKKARPPRSFLPDPWNCCHLSVLPRIARIWIGSGQRLEDLHCTFSLFVWGGSSEGLIHQSMWKKKMPLKYLSSKH